MYKREHNSVRVILIIAVILLASFFLAASAYGEAGWFSYINGKNGSSDLIRLDGVFDDWDGMPMLNDAIGDTIPQSDFVTVKWFPDIESGRLYMFSERLYGFTETWPVGKPVDWNFSVIFDNGTEAKEVTVDYHPESQQVDVRLYNERGGLKWRAKGKWGEDKYASAKVEFYVPLSYVAGDVESGYQIDMLFSSPVDRVPDYGYITISTASTFPWVTAVMLLLWIALLVFLHRRKMHFFKFLAGSIGMFVFIMIIGSGVGDKLLENAVTWGMWFVSEMTGSFAVLPASSMVTVLHGLQAVSYIIDYECSGFIELTVFLSILLFYPLFRWKKKVIYSVLGSLFILAANMARMLLITFSIKLFGTPVFFLSHTVFARILFFGLMVLLYYYVFTRQHIRMQRVGDLSYD